MFVLRNLPDVMFRFRPDGAQGGGDGGDGGQQQQQQQGGNQGQQGGQNSNNSSSQGQGGNQGANNQGLAGLLAKYDNNALAVAEQLLRDNYDARERARRAEDQVKDAVILREADKTTWEQYRALGAPSDIAAKLRQGDVERIAVKAGYTPDVLVDLDRMAGGKLQYEVKNETVDGTAVERIYVKDTSDANAAPKLLSDFASEKWAKYMPSLQPTGQSQSQGQGQGSGGSQSTTGTRFPAQGTGGSGSQGGSDAVGKFLEKQAEKDKGVTNPLLKK